LIKKMDYNTYKQKYNILLNPQQESAVKQISGQTLLLAVPGSGKTTVIVARLGYMIFCKGIRPENILTMTYNVSAAADMKKRFFDKFGDDFSGNIEFRTINGFCAHFAICFNSSTVLLPAGGCIFFRKGRPAASISIATAKGLQLRTKSIFWAMVSMFQGFTVGTPTPPAARMACVAASIWPGTTPSPVNAAIPASAQAGTRMALYSMSVYFSP